MINSQYRRICVSNTQYTFTHTCICWYVNSTFHIIVGRFGWLDIPNVAWWSLFGDHVPMMFDTGSTVMVSSIREGWSQSFFNPKVSKFTFYLISLSTHAPKRFEMCDFPHARGVRKWMCPLEQVANQSGEQTWPSGSHSAVLPHGKPSKLRCGKPTMNGLIIFGTVSPSRLSGFLHPFGAHLLVLSREFSGMIHNH